MNRRDLFKLAGAAAVAPYLPLGNCFVGYRGPVIDVYAASERFASREAALQAGCHTVAEFGPEAWSRESQEGLACLCLTCGWKTDTTITNFDATIR